MSEYVTLKEIESTANSMTLNLVSLQTKIRDLDTIHSRLLDQIDDYVMQQRKKNQRGAKRRKK